ncbi:MAG: hypothetical protein OEX12_00170 [Gammaproteobacteria bacterium]|nr:hypothetical protein [Gammaproteobacteria bacterium]
MKYLIIIIALLTTPAFACNSHDTNGYIWIGAGLHDSPHDVAFGKEIAEWGVSFNLHQISPINSLRFILKHDSGIWTRERDYGYNTATFRLQANF